jgi:hypothetical protein
MTRQEINVCHMVSFPFTFLNFSEADFVRVRVALRLAVYHQSVNLGAKPLGTQGQNFFFQQNTCGKSPYVTAL